MKTSRRGTRDGIRGSTLDMLSKGGLRDNWVELATGQLDANWDPGTEARNNGYAHGPYQDNDLKCGHGPKRLPMDRI